MQIYYLEISSWVGISVGASHTYAEIVKSGLMDPLAKEMSALFSRREAVTWARKWLRSNRSREKHVLILGRCATVEPQIVLVGPPAYKKEVNALFRRAKSIGYWDYDEATMNKICKQWEAVEKKWGTKR